MAGVSWLGVMSFRAPLANLLNNSSFSRNHNFSLAGHKLACKADWCHSTADCPSPNAYSFVAAFGCFFSMFDCLKASANHCFPMHSFRTDDIRALQRLCHFLPDECLHRCEDK